MLWCVSSSDSGIDTHGCIPELDWEHGPGIRNICLENCVIPAISLIIPLCLGRWEWAPLTVSCGSFRALRIPRSPSGFFPLLTRGSHHGCVSVFSVSCLCALVLFGSCLNSVILSTVSSLLLPMNPKNVWRLKRPHQTYSHNLHFKITELARDCPQAGYIIVI